MSTPTDPEPAEGKDSAARKDSAPRISFLCIGPQRTATSWLDQALRAHGAVQLPAHVKETFFFDKNYRRGLEWYHRLFLPAAEGRERLYGEVGPTYFESPEALERIRSYNPAMKIVVNIRNPVERSWSSFRHEYAKGRVGEDFFQALRRQPRIVDSGRYAEHLPRWEEAFGPSQILLMVQEDIINRPQEELDRLCRFLGLESRPLPEGLQRRYGQGTVPRFPWLAALASRTASGLRARGFYRLVEGAKRLGLKRIYRGGDPDRIVLTPAIRGELARLHREDINYLEERLNRPFREEENP